MNRRDFLIGAAAGGVAVGAVGAGVLSVQRKAEEEAAVQEAAVQAAAISKGLKELRMVTSWPKNFPGLGTSAERFATRVSSLTEGRITIKVFAGGELVQAFDANVL